MEVFCFGEENRQFLLSLGLCPVYLGSEPPPGNLWLAKLLILREALRRHRAVIWLDWDVHQLLSVPSRFWNQLASGAPLRVSLRQYRRRQCPWRKKHARKLPGGAVIYCRSLTVAQELVRIAVAHPQWTDEQVIARFVDLRLGESFDLSGWHQGGWELECYRVRGQLFPPSKPLFAVR